MFVIDEHGSGRSARSVGSHLWRRPSRFGRFVESTPESPSSVRVASFATAANRRLFVEGSLPLPSKVSIKKPCQYFYRSCKTADTQTATLTGFGKAPADVNAIPSQYLSPIGKLVFYALAAKACGTDRQEPTVGCWNWYLVNAASDCNFCHTSGGPQNFNFLMNHNPYFLGQKPKKTDPTQYLAGGAPFGAALPFNVGPGTAYGTYVGPTIVARNLTPDKNGLPEGGHTLAQFMKILRTGVDMDYIHTSCTSPGPPPVPANCIPPPVNWGGSPSHALARLSKHDGRDIEAIYEYLSAIPCIDNTWSTPPAGAPTSYATTAATDRPRRQSSPGSTRIRLRPRLRAAREH